MCLCLCFLFCKGRTADDGSALCSVQCLDPKRIAFSQLVICLCVCQCSCGSWHCLFVFIFRLDVLVVWFWCCIDLRGILPSLYIYICFSAGLYSVLQCCLTHTCFKSFDYLSFYDYLWFFIHLLCSFLFGGHIDCKSGTQHVGYCSLFYSFNDLFCRTDVTAVYQFSLWCS